MKIPQIQQMKSIKEIELHGKKTSKPIYKLKAKTCRIPHTTTR